MERKRFIRTCSFLTCGCLSAPWIFTGCSPVASLSATRTGENLSVSKAEFGTNPFVLIRNRELPVPIYLAKADGGGYLALSMQCTHRGCEVRPVGNELHCPCHGSAYDSTGQVISSPATRPLQHFPVTEDELQIYIHVSN